MFLLEIFLFHLRVNNIWKYVGRDGKYVKGTPINSKAAINYNYLAQRIWT